MRLTDITYKSISVLFLLRTYYFTCCTASRSSSFVFLTKNSHDVNHQVLLRRSFQVHLALVVSFIVRKLVRHKQLNCLSVAWAISCWLWTHIHIRSSNCSFVNPKI